MFTFKKKKYPSGDWYYELKYDMELIGIAKEVPHGYLAQGRKKPVGTLQEAAKQCLDSRMNRCMKEHNRLRKILQKVLASSLT